LPHFGPTVGLMGVSKKQGTAVGVSDEQDTVTRRGSSEGGDQQEDGGARAAGARTPSRRGRAPGTAGEGPWAHTALLGGTSGMYVCPRRISRGWLS